MFSANAMDATPSIAPALIYCCPRCGFVGDDGAFDFNEFDGTIYCFHCYVPGYRGTEAEFIETSNELLRRRPRS
jgi:hypothetical protein